MKNGCVLLRDCWFIVTAMWYWPTQITTEHCSRDVSRNLAAMHSILHNDKHEAKYRAEQNRMLLTTSFSLHNHIWATLTFAET